jgi:hypothetical protein
LKIYQEVVIITIWTKKEEQYLITNKELPLKEVAKNLNRPLQSIKDKRALLGLKKDKINDLRGKRFGNLMVIKEHGRLRGRVTWLCKCNCGNTKIVNSNSLIQNCTISCGCLSISKHKNSNIKDLTNQKFNNLLVLKQQGRSKHQQVKWLCRCDCGQETIVVSNNLLNGNTKSCGCKRRLNQRKGLAWERLVKRFLPNKFDNLLYHEKLENGTIPDFSVRKQSIILEVKRNDYVLIEKCIRKYENYCDKLIFICMEKKRKNWKKDFGNNSKIEFWYPSDLLQWIPNMYHKEFKEGIEEINQMMIENNIRPYTEIFGEAINQLESEKKSITQQRIAKKLGISKKSLRANKKFSNFIQAYNQTKKKQEEEILLEEIKKITQEKIRTCNKIMIQDIARLLIKRLSKDKKVICEQIVWTMTKKLSDNVKFRDLIEKEQKTLEKRKIEVIMESLKTLLKNGENITIQKVRKLTGLPKNYLYSEEIAKIILNY